MIDSSTRIVPVFLYDRKNFTDLVVGTILVGTAHVMFDSFPQMSVRVSFSKPRMRRQFPVKEQACLLHGFLDLFCVFAFHLPNMIHSGWIEQMQYRLPSMCPHSLPVSTRNPFPLLPSWSGSSDRAASSSHEVTNCIRNSRLALTVTREALEPQDLLQPCVCDFALLMTL